MTMPASGEITMSQIATEVYKSSTAAITLNDVVVRHLAGGSSSGAPIDMADFYGQTYDWTGADWGVAKLVYPTANAYIINPPAEADIWFNTDGTYDVYVERYPETSINETRNWHHDSPTAGWASYESNFFIKWQSISGDVPLASLSENTWYDMSNNLLNIGYSSASPAGTDPKSGVFRITIRYSNVVATEVSQDFEMSAFFDV